MKISFDCECVLLQETLKLFLKGYICSKKDCDFIIADRRISSQKPVFLIAKNSGHLQIPFSKENLLSTLEEFYSATQFANVAIRSEKQNFEAELDKILDQFKRDLLTLIKAHS